MMTPAFAMEINIPEFAAELRSLADAITAIDGDNLHPTVRAARLADVINAAYS